MSALSLVPKYANLSDSKKWRGRDPAPLLNAAQKASDLIAEAGFEVTVIEASASWKNGQAKEDSIGDLREAMRFTARPSGSPRSMARRNRSFANPTGAGDTVGTRSRAGSARRIRGTVAASSVPLRYEARPDAE